MPVQDSRRRNSCSTVPVCSSPAGRTVTTACRGKKLVVDAYGPSVPIGGGAWSGKDFHKVDRIGGLLCARTRAGLCARRGRKGGAGDTRIQPGLQGPGACFGVVSMADRALVSFLNDLVILRSTT